MKLNLSILTISTAVFAGQQLFALPILSPSSPQHAPSLVRRNQYSEMKEVHGSSHDQIISAFKGNVAHSNMIWEEFNKDIDIPSSLVEAHDKAKVDLQSAFDMWMLLQEDLAEKRQNLKELVASISDELQSHETSYRTTQADTNLAPSEEYVVVHHLEDDKADQGEMLTAMEVGVAHAQTANEAAKVDFDAAEREYVLIMDQVQHVRTMDAKLLTLRGKPSISSVVGGGATTSLDQSSAATTGSDSLMIKSSKSLVVAIDLPIVAVDPTKPQAIETNATSIARAAPFSQATIVPLKVSTFDDTRTAQSIAIKHLKHILPAPERLIFVEAAPTATAIDEDFNLGTIASTVAILAAMSPTATVTVAQRIGVFSSASYLAGSPSPTPTTVNAAVDLPRLPLAVDAPMNATVDVAVAVDDTIVDSIAKGSHSHSHSHSHSNSQSAGDAIQVERMNVSTGIDGVVVIKSINQSDSLPYTEMNFPIRATEMNSLAEHKDSASAVEAMPRQSSSHHVQPIRSSTALPPSDKVDSSSEGAAECSSDSGYVQRGGSYKCGEFTTAQEQKEMKRLPEATVAIIKAGAVDPNASEEAHIGISELEQSKMMQLRKEKLLLAKLDRLQKDIDDLRELIRKPVTLDEGSSINWSDPDTIFHREANFDLTMSFVRTDNPTLESKGDFIMRVPTTPELVVPSLPIQAGPTPVVVAAASRPTYMATYTVEMDFVIPTSVILLDPGSAKNQREHPLPPDTYYHRDAKMHPIGVGE